MLITERGIIPPCELRLKNCYVNLNSGELTMSSKNIRKSRSICRKIEQKEESEEEDINFEVVKVQVPKKKVAKFDINPKRENESDSLSSEEDDKSEDSDNEEDNESEDPDYEEDDENEDPDWEEETEKRKKKIFKKENVSDSTVLKVKKNLSTYEQMIQKNREAKMAFLQSIKIQEAKTDLLNIVNIKTKGCKKYKKRSKKLASPVVVRKSRRLDNCNMNLSENAMFLKAKAEFDLFCNDNNRKKMQPVNINFEESSSSYTLRKRSPLGNFSRNLSEDFLYLNAIKVAEESEEKKRVIPPETSFKDILKDCLYEDYVTDIIIQKSKSDTNLMMYDKSDLDKLTVTESNIVKITPGRITSLAWYPSPEQLIVTAGDIYGNLGVMNVDNDSPPYLMKIYFKNITHLQFNPFNQVQLISSSYDGILHCGDMIQHQFNEICTVSDKIRYTYFDILSATTFLVAQSDGQIALVDGRTKGKSFQKKHACHASSISTLNIHPANKNVFVSSGNDGSVRIWDLRKLQNDPVTETNYHNQAVCSAFFSPVTGNSILTTCADDTVSICDSSYLRKIKLERQLKLHDVPVKYLEAHRARWLPNSEEAFVIGSKECPHKIKVYDRNFSTYDISHENFTSITHLNVFHPSRRALAGGSSGRLFVFN